MNKSNWYVVKEDDRYVVLDNKELNKLVPSITKLNPHKATSGHSHDGQEEVYVFTSGTCLLYTSPSPRDAQLSRMPSSA